MLEAEIEDGDFTQITQAIQNALGPKKIVQTQIVRTTGVDVGLLDEPTFETESEDEASSSEQHVTPARSKAQTKRSFPTPEVVDVDWSVKPTIESYVASHKPASTTDKFLVVISWFKEAPNITAVTANQVYTCFRKLKWSTAIKDFSQPLRDLKGQQLITGGAKQGFSINHLGIAKVEEMAG